jgi:hypothetical protein
MEHRCSHGSTEGTPVFFGIALGSLTGQRTTTTMANRRNRNLKALIDLHSALARHIEFHDARLLILIKPCRDLTNL